MRAGCGGGNLSGLSFKLVAVAQSPVDGKMSFAGGELGQGLQVKVQALHWMFGSQTQPMTFTDIGAAGADFAVYDHDLLMIADWCMETRDSRRQERGSGNTLGLLVSPCWGVRNGPDVVDQDVHRNATLMSILHLRGYAAKFAIKDIAQQRYE